MPLRTASRALLVGASPAFFLVAAQTALPPHPPYPLGFPAGIAADDSADTPADTPAPDFALQTLAGDPFRLSEHRDHVVVLNFWATGCAPCRYEIPDLIALQEEFGTEDVVFVGVSTEKGNAQGVAYFAEEMGITYPIIVDDGSADRAYGPILSLPTTLLIDRAGRVRAHVPGMVARQMLEPALEVLVRE